MNFSRLMRFAVLLLPCWAIPQTFTDMSQLLQPAAPPGVRTGQRGASAADFNNDGRVDLYHANFRDPGRLYLNRGGDGFTDVLQQIPLVEGTNMWGAAFGDYNNDGYLDILFEDLSAPSKLYRNDRNGGFTEINQAANVSILSLAQGAAWSDFNRDGKLDFMIVNDIGPNQLFKNIDYDTFEDISSSANVQTSGNSYGISWGDINNDGFMDAYIATCHPSDPLRSINHLLLNNGDETFTNIAQLAGVADSLAGWGVQIFDYDGDLDMDIYVTNSVHPPRPGDNRLYRNNGNNQFVNAAGSAGIAGELSENSYGNAIADFNNDGWEDVYVSNLGRRDRLYINNGNGTFSDVAEAAGIPLNEHRAMALADINDDGWIDIFSAGSPANMLLVNNGGTNHWLRLNLRGTSNNYHGVDARVRLHAGGQTQLKAMRAGDSFCSQSHSITLHFGLGQATVVDSLIITWPTGVTDKLTNLTQIDQHLTIVEGGSINHRPSTFALLAPAAGDTVRTGTVPLVLRWNAPADSDADAHSYNIYLHGEELWTGAVHDTSVNGISDTSFTVPAALLRGNCRYRWVVDVSDGSEITAAEYPQSFVLNPFGELFELAVETVGGVDLASAGASWQDYDRDGDPDLFVVNAPNQRNELFRNNAGVLQAVTDGDIVNTPSTSFAAAWGDYDNDNWPDLFVANLNGENNLLYRNLAGTGFEHITTALPGSDGGNSAGAAWVDYNRDGWLDLSVINTGQNTNALYRNEGGGIFSAVSGQEIVTDVANSLSGNWGDYDNDGWPDLFVANSSVNQLYRNNGDGSFSRISSGEVVSDFGASRSGSWGDGDNDGDLDLFVANTGVNFLYENNGNGTFTRLLTPAPVSANNDSRAGLWGDFDNDGDADLFILNQSSYSLYLNNGNFNFSELSVSAFGVSITAAQGCALADVDNDGRLDLLTTNAVNNAVNYLFRNTIPMNNNWLLVSLVGTLSNRSAIGARVRLRSMFNGEPRWQMRELAQQSSLSSQNDSRLHFGIGGSTQIDSLIVEWPSGARSRLAALAANQMLTVVEDSSTAIGGERPEVPRTLQLAQNYPNPFNPVTNMEFAIPNAERITLAIYDIRGRRVTTLVSRELAAGYHRYQWDGTAGDGRPAASGVYVYRLTAGEQTLARKLLLVR